MPKPKELLFDAKPHLRSEWDYIKNIGLDPETLSTGSGKDAWWVCSSGHSWKVRVWARGTRDSGCRQCNLAKQTSENPLTLSPDLADQLDDPRYTASQLNRSTPKKVWWKCGREHRWEAAVSTRYHGNVGCPYCSGRLPIVGETDLATVRPDLASQWDDDTCAPTEFTVSSMKKVRWKCCEGHQWVTAIHYRHHSRTKGNGCPYCPGSRGRYSKILVGINDLATLHPEISAQLHSTDIAPQELREYSSKKLEWKCSEGHIWVAAVSERTLGSGCKQCSISHTSKIEGRLRELIDSKDYLSGTVLDHNHILDIPWRNRKRMKVDIYCEWRGLPVVIEYDGAYWHYRDASLLRDKDKTTALLEQGYLVVRVRENKLPFVDIAHDNLLQLNVVYSLNDENLEEAVDRIEDWLNSRK